MTTKPEPLTPYELQQLRELDHGASDYMVKSLIATLDVTRAALAKAEAETRIAWAEAGALRDKLAAATEALEAASHELEAQGPAHDACTPERCPTKRAILLVRAAMRKT